jgi:hypothetical protein
MERLRVLQPQPALTAVVRAWDRFWFRPEPTSALAIVRIAFGLLTLAWTAMLVPDAGDFFGRGGLGAGQRVPALVLAVLLLAAACVTVGLRSRLAAAAVLVCLVWLERTNPLLWNTGDVLLRHLALFLALAPAGESLSIDRWRRTRSQFWQFPSRAPWAIRLIQLQVALMYVVSVVDKLHGWTWLHGSAVSYVLRVPGDVRFALPTSVSASPVGAHLLTWATLGIEAAIPVLVWSRRTRPYVLAGGIALHISIGLTLRVGFFSWTILVAYLAFLSPDTATRLVGWVTRRRSEDRAAA